MPVYAQHSFVHANRVDARFVDHKANRVLAVEISCPWLDNRARKDTEKTGKYEPLQWEFNKQYPGYKIVQLNAKDAKELDVEMKKVFGTRSIDILKRIQKAVLFSSLNIARTFKAVAKLRPRLRYQEIIL